jgi:CMP-N-acetylneuraminic acid synthetase
MNVVLIPMRGGSKSIPKKNIKPMAGKPLCYWVIKAASDAETVDRVYVSTDSDEIAEVVNGMGLNVIVLKRPSELATDQATTESVMIDFLHRVDFDTLVTVQATSPMLTGEDLDKAMARFESQKFNSMLSAVRVKRFFWNDNGTPVNYDPLSRPRRQDFSGTLMENGAFYITRRDTLDEYQCRLGGRIGVYEMANETALEIDEPEDWDQVEKLLYKIRC